MLKSELIDRLNGLKVKLLNDNIGDADYEILENWYIALDLDKDIFAKIIATIGIETLVERHAHATKMVDAMDEYNQREKYKRDKIRLEEMEREVERLRESTKAFEKKQVY